MSQYDFQRYLENKYDTVQLTQIHHYETIRQFDLDDNVILEGGLVVDEDFTFNYTQDGTIENISGSELVKSVSNYEYEIEQNDKKREILLLRKEYIGVIKEDMRDIMTYQDSSQYINKKMKKGENSDYIDETNLKLTQNLFPKYKLSIVKNAGHWLHHDNFDEFFSICISNLFLFLLYLKHQPLIVFD